MGAGHLPRDGGRHEGRGGRKKGGKKGKITRWIASVRLLVRPLPPPPPPPPAIGRGAGEKGGERGRVDARQLDWVSSGNGRNKSDESARVPIYGRRNWGIGRNFMGIISVS